MGVLRAPVAHLPAIPVASRRRDVSCWLAFVQEAFAKVPGRGWHSRVVWQRVVGWRRELAELPAADRATLELAALLHDIGRAIDPLDLEPHAVVGAQFLDDIGLTDVAPLVAHHSGARLEAAARGMEHLDRWRHADPVLQPLLDYADRTVNSRGQMVTLDQRRDDLTSRFGAASPQVVRFELLLPDAQATEAWLAARR
ncbi:MAG: HD domain-containing protein [Actinomycetota bacterium]